MRHLLSLCLPVGRVSATSASSGSGSCCGPSSSACCGASGSSANLVMIGAIKKILGWKDGDEVIVSPVGFPTTIAPLVQHGLKPVFVDIEFDTLNFDVNLIEKKITDRTRGIFVSPVLGNPPDMDIILDLCDLYDIEMILKYF